MCLVASVCLSLCLSVCNTLTTESLHLKSVFLACGYIFRIFRSCSYLGHRVEVNVKVIGTNSSSVFAVQTLNVGCFDLERWFFVWGTSEYLGQVRMSRSSGQGQGHRSNDACLCVLFTGGLPLIEMRSCFRIFFVFSRSRFTGAVVAFRDVTKVGVTRCGNWWCHSFFSSEKVMTFLGHRPQKW